MRTFGVLLAGWVLGGATIALLSADWAVGAPRLGAPAIGAPASSRPVRRLPGGRQDAGGPAGRMPALQIPVFGVSASDLSDTFSQPRGAGRVHRAMDILAPRGTPVIAAVDGTIQKLFTSKAGGLTIYQFDREEQRVYYYAHLDSYAAGVGEGVFAAQGTVIGYVGTTGNAGNTPHLHFSVEVLPPTKEWWKGEPVNPYPLLTR